MPKRQSDDLKHWAVLGAEQRLVQLGEEARAIFRYFPELRGKGRGFQSTPAPGGVTERQQAPKVRRRRRLSAEARKRIGEAVKARWARQKAGKTEPRAAAPTAVRREAKAGKAAHTKGRRRGRRKMSVEARKRISEAQKARWAKQKGEQPGAAASEITGSETVRRRGSRKKK